MPNIIDILARAQSLMNETALNSITPPRAGGIMYDTLLVLNQMQLEGASLLISKVYASVSAMEADTTPTSDLTGRALKPGQLVVIVTSNASSSDMGSEYRYNGPGSWTYVGKVGGLPLDTVPTQNSTKGITSGGVYTALAAMKAEGYKYMGLATPGSGGTSPGTPNQPVFYIAGPGSYPNFGSITVASGYLGFIKYSSGSWSVESVAVGKDYDAQISALDGQISQLEAEVDEDITDLETATNTKIGGPIVLKEDVSWTARSFEHPISIPRGCTISVKLIADGVTPSAGLRVRVKYVDDTLVDFTSSPLTSIGATATLTAVKNVKAITFYNNDAYTSASVKITAPFSVVGTMNTDTIRGTRTDFIKLDEQFNLYVYSDAIVDTYIDGTGGYELNNTGLVASPFVPVEQNKTYYIGGKVLAKYYAFYDEDKTYISGDNSTSGYMTQITAPANAAFIRFTGQVATYQSIVFSLNPLADTTNKYTTKDNIVLPIDISAEELTDAELLDAGNIIDRSKLTVGAYISATDGSLTPVPAQPQWVATDWCDIDATKKYSWFKLADFYAAFYDEKKAFIRGYSTGDRLPNPVTPPVNAKYARFTISNTAANAYGVYPVESCWCAADSENTQPNEFKSFVLPKEIFTEREFGTNPCDYTGKEISVFNKLLCVGDSLMYGAENVATGSPYIAAKEPLYNIPSFIKKMAGIDTTNAAHSGYTAEQWLADFSDDDLSGHDACIIQIGVNNWLTWADDEDAGIATFKSSLGDIIDLVISQNSYNDGGVLKNKIKVFVATQFPSKSYLKNTDGVSLDVLNEAIREVVAGRSDCFLLDMAVYSHSNDKLAFNRGHLTAIGYRQVAQDYCGIISKFIHDNFDLFVDVPFIGTNATQFQYSPTQI